MISPPTTRSRLTDRARRSWYLTRFLFAMQDYPSKEYQRIRDGLRTDLDAAAADVGMHRALADLGSPLQLANGYYGQLDGPRPRYLDGAVVAVLLGLMVVYSFLSYAVGAVDTLIAQGGGVVELHYLGGPMTVTGTDDALSVEAQLSWQGAVVFFGTIAAGFLIGSRIWRLAAGRTPVSPGR